MMMSTNHMIEIFSAGCAACTDVTELVNRVATPGASIQVLDMRDPAVASRAKALGVRRVPSVTIDGKLASCCAGAGVDEAQLVAALKS